MTALRHYRFENPEQVEDLIVLVLGKGKNEEKVAIHREINVVARSEALARARAARRKLGEDSLPETYALSATFSMGKNWQ